jgi:hypothetical protein
MYRCQDFILITKDVRPNYNLSGDEISIENLSPWEKEHRENVPTNVRGLVLIVLTIFIIL